MASDKLPAMQFYPGDWLKDPGIRSLTLEEQGAWLNILFLMHESDDRGKLTLCGKPLPIEFLANSLGITTSKARKIFQKLIDAGVATLTEDGVLISRRMVRDNQKRTTNAIHGRAGGVAKARNAASETASETLAKSSASSSSSSSSSITDKQEAAPPPDRPITKTEISETPTDGPSPVTMLDGGEFIIEWNALAEDHSCLVPHGATMLSRFEFDNFRDRIGAGTWSASWQAFKDAVCGGKVTSKGITLKKLLEGAVLDVVAAEQQRRKAAMSPTTRKRKPQPGLPTPTKERPFRHLDRYTLDEQIVDFGRCASKEESGGDIEKAKAYRKRQCELESEREWRDSNVQARRRECLEAGGIAVPDGEIPNLGKQFE
jgi:hypothetical protein